MHKHFSPPAPAGTSEGWRSTDEAPEDPGAIEVRSISTYRFQLYKPDGVRKMRRRGRWQRLNEHGTWENAELPMGEFKPAHGFGT